VRFSIRLRTTRLIVKRSRTPLCVSSLRIPCRWCVPDRPGLCLPEPVRRSVRVANMTAVCSERSGAPTEELAQGPAICRVLEEDPSADLTRIGKRFPGTSPWRIDRLWLDHGGQSSPSFLRISASNFSVPRCGFFLPARNSIISRRHNRFPHASNRTSSLAFFSVG
jgi:hypothetical protein